MSYSTHRHLMLPLAFALLTTAAACNSNSSATPTTPTTPTTVTESFSGTVNRNGAATHSFAITASGAVAASLTGLSPDSTAVLGFSLGTWNGVLCQVVLANDQATQGTLIQGNASAVGTLCVRLYDVGNLTAPASYEVQVVHY